MWKNDRTNDRSGGDFKRRPFSGGGGRPFSDDKRSFPSRGGGFEGRRDGGFKKPEPRQQVIYVELSKGALMPKYMTEEATGADTHYNGKEDINIAAGEIAHITTGVILKHLPPRLEIQVRSRSSLAAKGLLLLGPVSYSGEDKDKEIVLTFVNISKEAMIIKSNERIAQLVFSFVQKVNINLHNELAKTERNEGGFGSTGRGFEDTERSN